MTRHGSVPSTVAWYRLRCPVNLTYVTHFLPHQRIPCNYALKAMDNGKILLVEVLQLIDQCH